ncbi:MAG: TatD family hydrolase [Candidatus Woesearchaeota archaeon]
MLLVDVHAHIDFPEYDTDRDAMIERCKENGVKAIICNATTIPTMQHILEISKKYDIVKPAFGIYPSHMVEYSPNEFEAALDWIRINKPIAIGEIGLDYQEVAEQDRPLAEERFREQIRLAKELDVPVIVHSRKAEERTIEVLEEEGAKKVVMHCFSGKRRLIKRIGENKWCMSIPANVGRSEHFRMAIQELPLKSLLTETDSPLLSPVLNERNEPLNVIEGVKAIAELKGLTEEEAAGIVFQNYQSLFK